SSIRDLRYVSSENETNFGKTRTLLTPSASGWDGGFLYRASLLKVDNHYRLYYSAFDGLHVWRIVLIACSTIETMQDTPIRRSITKTADTLTTKMMASGNVDKSMIVLNDLTTIVTDKGVSPQVKLVENGVTSASYKLKNNGFTILSNNDTSLGGLDLG